MRNISYSISIILFSLISLAMAKPVVVAYYPDWLISGTSPEEIHYDGLTHIIQSFAWPDEKGELVYNGYLINKELIDSCRANGVKAMIALGGWGQCQEFSSVCGDSSLRAVFIDNIMKFCEVNGFDGVDIDWEHPSTVSDKNHLTLFVKELREKMNEVNEAFCLSMAIVSGSWGASMYDYKSLTPYLDWFGAMSYDFHGNWVSHIGHCSPLYPNPRNDPEGSVSGSMAYLKSKIPEEKIVMGMPFYGIRFIGNRLNGPHSGASSLVYSDIYELIQSGNYETMWDDLAKVPYLLKNDSSELITYDDSLSISLKCQFAIEEDLGGVMIWALGQDDLGGEQPLMKTVVNEMKEETAITDFLVDRESKKRTFPMEIFPNPSRGTFVIRIYARESGGLDIKVYDILGRTVYKNSSVFVNRGWGRIQLALKDLPSGNYFIKASWEDRSNVKPFVVVQ